MAGELTFDDWSGDNVANTNFANPYRCLDIDVGNSGQTVTAVQLCASGGNPIGVLYDKSKLNPDGTVAKNSGVVIRSWGIAKVEAGGAISPGDLVKCGNASSQITTQATNAAFANTPILGRALQSAAIAGDQILVLLTIGSRI